MLNFKTKLPIKKMALVIIVCSIVWAILNAKITFYQADTSAGKGVCDAFNGEFDRSNVYYNACTLNSVNLKRINELMMQDKLNDSDDYTKTLCSAAYGTLVKSHKGNIDFRLCLIKGK